jgi:6-phosphogluconolactonase
MDKETGKLKELNQVASGGGAPCHLVVDRRGRHVLAANYSGGSVGAWAIAPDGSLGDRTAFVQHEGSSVNPRRQEAPHAHSINLDGNNRFAVAADLGLDKVLVYRFRPRDGSLEALPESGTDLKPGAGPRHFAFHPDYRFAYVINEMQSTVTAMTYQRRQGRLREIQTLSTLPPGFEGNNSTAEVQVHPSGKFLYGSNRGHDSIAVFGIDQETGKLTWVENEPTQGRTPRNFGVDPTGRYLLAANQSSDTIVVFGIDQTTGALSPAGHQVEVPSPVCVKFAAMP